MIENLQIVDVLLNPYLLWSLLFGTWTAIAYRALHHRRGGPKAGPTPPTGNMSFSKSHLSEEEIFRILTTTEVNIQIVRICETPKPAREISKALGDIYPGHKEKGFPPDKLGEHLANLERLGALKFNGERWAATDVGVKMVRKYFG